MDELENGANDNIIAELEQLFNDETSQETPPETTNTEAQSENNTDNSKVDTTKAFAKRLKESTDKARREERDNIAKSLGYNSYEELQKSRENNMLKDKGLNPDEVSPIIDELVKQRINEDPRMKELEGYRQREMKEFAKKELEEISKLTNGEITKLEQLPPQVVDLWKTEGSLKSAYLKCEGERLILKARSDQSRGSTSHLQNLQGATPTPSNKRALTDEEKEVWKFFNRNITDEELNKKMIDK